MTSVLEALALLTPCDTDVEKVRVGPEGDGGYVLAAMLAPTQTVLSYGVSTQYEFDIAMARKGHRVLMFDHTIDGIEHREPGMEWHKEGVAAKDRPAQCLYTIETHLERLAVEGDDLILKIDVGGDEYAALGALSSTALNRFSQIVVEVHWLSRLANPSFRDRFARIAGKLARHFYLHHVHANNYDGYDKFHIVDGLIVSNLLELSYLRKDLATARRSATVYPTELDFANVGGRDKLLWFFPFAPIGGSETALGRSYATSRRRGVDAPPKQGLPQAPASPKRPSGQSRAPVDRSHPMERRTMEFKPNLIHHRLELPPPASDAPSVFAFSFAKAGSTLMYNMLRELAPQVGLTYYSPQDELFAANVGSNERPAQVGNIFLPTGYCYGGFRAFPTYPIATLHSSPAAFLVRDPRDMAVSLYYSMLKSHQIPEGADGGVRDEMLKARERVAQISIDDFVVNSAATQYLCMFEGYAAQGFSWRPNVTIFRYEDVIFSKGEWLRSLCNAYGWDIPDKVLDDVAARHDERPTEERQDQHVRKVTPGDYLNQLEPRTIVQLNRMFAEYMRVYEYAD